MALHASPSAMRTNAVHFAFASAMLLAVLVCVGSTLSWKFMRASTPRRQVRALDQEWNPAPFGMHAAPDSTPSPPPPRIVLGMLNVRTAGVGNVLQFMYKFLSLSRCLDADAVIPTHSINKIGPNVDRRFLRGEDMSLYDLDVLADYARTVHYKSVCNCIDVTVLKNGTGFTDSGAEGAALIEIATRKTMFSSPRGLSPDALIAEMLEGVGPSRCGNPLPCVPLGNHNTAMEAMARMDTAACRGRPVELPDGVGEYSDQAASSFVVPSPLMRSWAKSLLPRDWDFDSLLVVHLRYVCGEYKRKDDICNRGDTVCVGRAEEPLRAMKVNDFGNLVKLLAQKLGCKHVFPILPPPFTSQALRTNVSQVFGLNFEDLISSKNLDLFWTLMVERSVATYAKHLVDETRSSFATTLERSRLRLNLTDFIPLWQTLEALNSTQFEIIDKPR
ncbi:hypothetical protein FVE85_4219 [Porphyridium purpureum]|uniref:Uncharacterized protein n=1 Tax=Porphyridium purpureum TaxID=35688 RepID=A0A5J4YU68_PORPP|nr:hypothetical protein FVE85_4219 [Porphyridium purpureum]|eukprot:POR6984..scf229_5